MTVLRCLFHADDCGLTPGVTAGILEAARRGRLQSTSIMAGGLDAAGAAAGLRALPQVFAAVHLNLLEGKAGTDPGLVPDLVDGRGFFRLSLGALLVGLFNGGKRAQRLCEQIHAEFCAQIDAVRQGTGREAVRLDGHLHVHAIPSLLPVMEDIFRSYPVEYVRVPHEPRHMPPVPRSRLLPGVLCRELLAAWSPRLRALALRHGVAVPDYFVGAYASGSMSLAALRRSLERVSRLAGAARATGAAPLVEIMLHPGRNDTGNGAEQAAWYGASRYAKAHNRPEREAELTLLLSDGFAELLKEFGLVPLVPS